MPGVLTPASVMGGEIAPADGVQDGGRRRRGASVKTLKKMLKKAGLKTTGRKAALTRRAKKAHLKLRGGQDEPVADNNGNPPAEGGKKKSRRSRGFRLY